MRINDKILKCVVFIGIEVQAGSKTTHKWCGTGFFVSIQSITTPDKKSIFLVTAKHVVADIGDRTFTIRVNTKDGKSALFKCDPNDPGGIRWYFHPCETESADVAVFPIITKQNTINALDFTSIPENLLLTDATTQSEQIFVGDEVCILGLFAFHSGNKKNQPILRMGHIAMIPDEPIPTNKFGNLELILIESRSIGGLSGSPVFVLKPLSFEVRKVFCLGLIHGHWDVPSDSNIDSEERRAKYLNVGIAMVTPAKKVLETINQPGLQFVRNMLDGK